MSDTDDLELDDLDLEGDTDDGSGDPGDAGTSAPPKGEAPKAKDGDESKRVNDLMSKWQSAQAENARLKAQLAGKDTQAGAKDRDELPAEVRQWVNAAKDLARERAFNADPRLSEYGIELSAIDGETPDEVNASAKRYRELIDAIETKARDRVLREHGLTPDSAGGAPAPKYDFGSMKDDDFDRLVASVTGSI